MFARVNLPAVSIVVLTAMNFVGRPNVDLVDLVTVNQVVVDLLALNIIEEYYYSGATAARDKDQIQM